MKLILTFLGILIFGMAVFMGMNNLDPDFGWHIKVGEYTAQTGIDKTDRFSYTMPEFSWVDHEWLTNIGMYEIYKKWGMVGEAIVFGLIVAGAFWVIVKAGGTKWMVVPAVLMMAIWLVRAGVRPQVITWLGLGLVVWGRKKWWWPILFLIWVNLHGGFAIGIAVGLIILIFNVKLLNFKNVLAWILSVGATFINPYGWRIWEEIWRQFSDTGLRFTIAEWMPFYAQIDLGFLIMLVFVGVIVWRQRREVPKWQIAILIGTAVAGLSSLRHMALFVVVAAPMIGQGLGRLEKEVVKDELSKKRMQIFGRVLMGITALVLVGQLVIMFVGGKRINYPEVAINWLKQNQTPGQMFSDYGWGGYLNWQYPERKVFIDGRMPSWSFGKLRINPMKEYLQITRKGEYQDIFAKYNVQTVLWPVGEKMKFELSGWKKVYEDKVAVVMVK